MKCTVAQKRLGNIVLDLVFKKEHLLSFSHHMTGDHDQELSCRHHDRIRKLNIVSGVYNALFQIVNVFDL